MTLKSICAASQGSMQTAIKHPNVVEPSSAVPLCPSKKNDVISDPLTHITEAGLPRPINENLSVLICSVPARVVDFLVVP
jgi:hypothetical protein